ncbi:hypothetical protein L6232_20420, partial [Shewanella sp. C31]|nr:hypothetical protein [Shewanella electrica]
MAWMDQAAFVAASRHPKR